MAFLMLEIEPIHLKCNLVLVINPDQRKLLFFVWNFYFPVPQRLLLPICWMAIIEDGRKVCCAFFLSSTSFYNTLKRIHIMILTNVILSFSFATEPLSKNKRSCYHCSRIFPVSHCFQKDALFLTTFLSRAIFFYDNYLIILS
jgi:hypothetical protein